MKSLIYYFQSQDFSLWAIGSMRKIVSRREKWADMCFKKNTGCPVKKTAPTQAPTGAWLGGFEVVKGNNQFWNFLEGRSYDTWKWTGHGDWSRECNPRHSWVSGLGNGGGGGNTLLWDRKPWEGTGMHRRLKWSRMVNLRCTWHCK